tara:strand:- start:187 stop:513 length:327 start_codon:yes stop_codon:yes gene_type:complete
MADIDDMINNVVNQDFSKSQTYFDAIMQAKMSDSLEQEKIAMANKIFNLDNPEGENYEEPTETEEELEDDSEEFSEEELDAAAEESLEDEEEDDEEDDELEDYSDEEE